MKTKIFTMFGLSVLTLLMITTFVSAATLAEWSLTTDGVATNVATNVATGTFTSFGVIFNGFGSDGANAEDWSTTNSVDDSKYFEVTISPDADYTLAISGIDFDYSASIVGPASFELRYSTDGFSSSESIVIEDDVTSTEEKSSTNDITINVNEGETLTLRWYGYDFNADSNEFRIKDLILEGTPELVEPDFCAWDDGWELGEDIGNPGELKIKNIDFINRGISKTRFGDDEDWFLFEEIEVDVEVQNKGDWDVDDIVVEWGLYNEGTGEWTIEVDDEDEFNLNEDGDTETLTISFTIDDNMDEEIDELKEGTYRLYVRATGQIYDSDADEYDEEYTCASDFSEAEIVIEKDLVVLDNLQYNEVATCGSFVEVTADVWNIGTADQENVYVRIYNEELDINEKIDVGDLDSLRDEKLSFLVNIPQDAEEKSHHLIVRVYDDDQEVFKTDFDEDDVEFVLYIKVEGNCISEPKVKLEAELESEEAKAGEELIIRVTVENTGIEESTFEISLTDYEAWATFESLSPEEVTLEAGESEDVLITLKVNSDVSGTKDFDVVVTEGTKVLTKKIEGIMIEEKKGFSGITGGLISEGNWPIWTIGAINVILVFIIILVALKVARKS